MPEPIAHETRSPSEPPLPPDPPWVASWLVAGGPRELDVLREIAERSSPALREAFARFSPGCVVRCACGEVGCHRAAAIVTGASEREQGGVVLLVRRWPEDQGLEVPLKRARFDIVHLRGGLTLETARAAFAPRT